MFTTCPVSRHAAAPSTARVLPALAVSGLLALSMTAMLGIVPAHAQSASDDTSEAVSQAIVAPTATPSQASIPETPTAAGSTPAPADAPAATPPPAASPTSGDVAKYGAFMGIGLAKEAPSQEQQLRGTMAESPLSAAVAQPLAAVTPAGVLGMDVSGWQADSNTHTSSQVDWTGQWRLGARFVYIKATEGSSFRDGSFSSHFQGASNVGMLRGGYHFALPNASGAVTQANFFVDNGGGWSADGKTLPPLLDIENNPYGDTCYGLSQSQMVSWISSFSRQVQSRTGRLPMIYTNYYWWQDCTGNSQSFTNQPLHIAAYGTTDPWMPGGWKNYSVWQYSDAGPFAGDSNTWNGTQASLKTFATGAGTPVPAPVDPVGKPAVASTADVVAADSSGVLWNYPGNGSGGFGTRKQIGQGWNSMRSITAIDWNSDGVLDLLAQRTNGSLSLYRGLSGGGFAAPQALASSGWSGYQLTVGYWLNSSKYPQILTRGTNGDLNLWTNPAGSSLGAATRFAQGWNGINLTMLDFDGDGRQDLLAQYPDGTLRLARSDGAGAFVNEPRKTIGTGWKAYTSVTVYSDFASAGSTGIIRRTTAGAIAYVPVPGNSTFGSQKAIGSGWSSYLIAGGENINMPQPPLAPPAPKAVPGNGNVAVSVPKNAGGAAATSVSVTAAPGGAACTIAAASGTCTVAGLANGTSYSFRAVARNAAGVSPFSAASSSAIPYAPVYRISGLDRYATSAAVSESTFAAGVNTAYIASGATYPDALSGAAAAGSLSGPVLLTAATGLPDATRTELTRLKPHRIILLGGTGALNNTVQTQLKQYSTNVSRLSGSDRYATSAAISKATFAAGVNTAYIASGDTYPDALSGAAAAGSLNGPVLLATSSGLPAAIQSELSRLRPKRIIVLGGAAALNATVQTQLSGYVD